MRLARPPRLPVQIPRAIRWLSRLTESTVELLRRYWLPLCAAAWVALLYALPQLIQAARGYGGPLLIQEDEPFYIARFVRALQGDPQMSPWLYEHRSALSIVPGFVERGLAAPWRLIAALGLPVPPPNLIVAGYRVLFAALGMLCMTFAFNSVGLTLPLATLSAFATYLDPGVFPYKPILGFFTLHSQILDRFPSPAVGITIMSIAWGCYARVSLGGSTESAADRARRTRYGVGAGVAAGLLFYVSFYYWTFFFAVVGLTTAVRLRERWRMSLLVSTIALLVSLHYWSYALAFRGSELYTQILWRTDFISNGRGVSFHPNRTMWFFVLCALTAWQIGTASAQFLVISILAGLACFYSGLVTGLSMPNSLENSHWNIALAPLILAACVWSAAFHLSQSKYAQHARALATALAAVFALGGTWNFLTLSRELDHTQLGGVGALHPAYAGAWRFLREQTPDHAVVLASERTMGHVPLELGKYVWIHRLVYPDAIGPEEILARYRVYWALGGQQAPAVESFLASHHRGTETWFWGWGLTRALQQGLQEDGWPPLDALRWRLFVTTIRDLVANTTPEQVRVLGQAYRLDYLVRGPNEGQLSGAERYLRLTQVYRDAAVRVDRVDGWH